MLLLLIFICSTFEIISNETSKYNFFIYFISVLIHSIFTFNFKLIINLVRNYQKIVYFVMHAIRATRGLYGPTRMSIGFFRTGLEIPTKIRANYLENCISHIQSFLNTH